MSKHYKLEDFKVGDVVWVSGAGFHKSGRIKFNLRPKQTTIKAVDPGNGFIEVESCDYYLGNRFYSCDYTWYNTKIDTHISLTKEEALEKYNAQIKDSIEDLHSNFRNIERRLLGYLL